MKTMFGFAVAPCDEADMGIEYIAAMNPKTVAIERSILIILRIISSQHPQETAREIHRLQFVLEP